MAGPALFLCVAAFFLPGIPAAQKYLGLHWLQQPMDYGVVGLVVLTWALILNMVWWLIPPEPYPGPPEEYSGPPEDEGGRN